uniref:Uncharacterized protein n=1 Tax=Kalanchoe fedtschenkoi TaxID=63787 RepID=A0A7N0ZX33_KALFE
MSANAIRIAGAKALAEAVANKSGFRKLNINDNYIFEEGVPHAVVPRPVVPHVVVPRPGVPRPIVLSGSPALPLCKSATPPAPSTIESSLRPMRNANRTGPDRTEPNRPVRERRD